MKLLSMNAHSVAYPALCFSQGNVSVINDEAQLTTCGTLAIKNGYFKNMTLIGADGLAHKVNGADKLHGVGLFGGYRLLRSRRIRVRPIFKGDAAPVTLDEVKDWIFQSFRKWHGWEARGDFDELQQNVRKAQTIPELIGLLKEGTAMGSYLKS